MTVFFYFDHQEGVFQGLIPILNCYLENMEVDVDTRCTILNYLKLIKKRASGAFTLQLMFTTKNKTFLTSRFNSEPNSLFLLM